MIFDNLKNLKRYGIPKAEAIAHFIATHDCANLPNGEMEIQGRELFVRIMEYEPKPADQNKFETHRVNADVQYVVKGIELMQIAHTEDLAPITDYDPVGDFHFFKADHGITDIVVKEGEFTVFYPGEAHRPACLYKDFHAKVKKLVFKIKI